MTSSSAFSSVATETAAKIAEELSKKYILSESSLIAQSIGGAVFGGLATIVLGDLLSAVFPPDGSDYFDCLTRLDEIVNQAIEKNTQSQISGAFNEVFRSIKNEYAPLRNDSTPLADKANKLLDQLRQHVQTITTASAGGGLGTLQTDQYAQIGFPAFLLGANLHLALLQEMAIMYYFVDQETYEAYIKPRSGVIAQYASDYVDFARTTWEKIKVSRRDQISIQKAARQISTGRGVVWEDYVAVFDQGKEDMGFSSYTSEMKGFAALYVDKSLWPSRLQELSNSLNNPPGIANSWSTLIDTPTGASIATWPPSQAPIEPGKVYYIMAASNAAHGEVDTLAPGDVLASTTGAYLFACQEDGQWTLSMLGGDVLWHANGAGPGGVAFMQDDGNFVIYKDGIAQFASGTQSNPHAILVVSNDGQLQLYLQAPSEYAPTRTPIWSRP
ncbi:hypothetical protein VZQ01_41490 [Myxococcus faecalis]|uniref:hypothetical protein n=1 Tax=Myxococcus faecalis TaxID=3115646 RepID=UPI003CEB0F79